MVIDRGIEVEARVTALTAAGAPLNLHCGRGMRSFLLAIGDNEPLSAEPIETLRQGSGQRICRFRPARPGEKGQG